MFRTGYVDSKKIVSMIFKYHDKIFCIPLLGVSRISKGGGHWTLWGLYILLCVTQEKGFVIYKLLWGSKYHPHYKVESIKSDIVT